MVSNEEIMSEYAFIEHSISAAERAVQSLYMPSTFHAISNAGISLDDAICDGRRVFLAGNGGCHSIAEHISAELTARLKLDRAGLPVQVIGSNPAHVSAWSNDFTWRLAYKREYEAMGYPGDPVVIFSTSGDSPNLIELLEAGKAAGALTVCIVGKPSSGLEQLKPDILIRCPGHTAPAQVAMLAVGHAIADIIETLEYGRSATLDIRDPRA